MKKQFILFATLCIISIQVLHAQVPRFVKYDIMDTGAKAYFPSDPGFELSYSEDNSKVFSSSVEFGGANYGIIMVELAEPLGENEEEVWQELLLSYLDYLSSEVFQLSEVVPPGLGHKLESHPEAIGVLLYGETEEKLQYVIKGWTDRNIIAVMYISSENEIIYNVQEMYLNGFRFPEQ